MDINIKKEIDKKPVLPKSIQKKDNPKKQCKKQREFFTKEED